MGRRRARHRAGPPGRAAGTARARAVAGVGCDPRAVGAPTGRQHDPSVRCATAAAARGAQREPPAGTRAHELAFGTAASLPPTSTSTSTSPTPTPTPTPSLPLPLPLPLSLSLSLPLSISPSPSPSPSRSALRLRALLQLRPAGLPAGGRGRGRGRGREGEGRTPGDPPGARSSVSNPRPRSRRRRRRRGPGERVAVLERLAGAVGERFAGELRRSGPRWRTPGGAQCPRPGRRRRRQAPAISASRQVLRRRRR